MKEETMIEAINDIDSIRCMVEDIHEEITNTPDYWEKLLHQYAGMAMNALLLTNNIRNGDLEGIRECNTNAMAIAYALVEKLKEKEESK